MVKFVVVRAKPKFSARIADSQLEDHDFLKLLDREEQRLNEWILKGFEVIHCKELEDHRWHYLLFVLYKEPKVSS